jgi:hypothetical protein
MPNTQSTKHTLGPWFVGTGWIGAGEVRQGHVICRFVNYPYGDACNDARQVLRDAGVL